MAGHVTPTRVAKHGAQKRPRRSHEWPPTARRLDAPHCNAGNSLAVMPKQSLPLSLLLGHDVT
jgi:hypothetical protein